MLKRLWGVVLLLFIANGLDSVGNECKTEESSRELDDEFDELVARSEAALNKVKQERFLGFRFQVTEWVDGNLEIVKHEIQKKADSLACFGWVQDVSSEKRSVVGEARCGRLAGREFLQWFQQQGMASLTTRIYPDTKIKLHFSRFTILPSERKTCFFSTPHKCPSQEDMDSQLGDESIIWIS